MATEPPVDMDEESCAEDDKPNPTAEPLEQSQGSVTKTAHTRMSRKRTKTGCLSKLEPQDFWRAVLIFLKHAVNDV